MFNLEESKQKILTAFFNYLKDGVERTGVLLEVQSRSVRGNWQGWSAENSQWIQGKTFSAYARKREQDCFLREDEPGAKGGLRADSTVTDQGMVLQHPARVGRVW